MKTTNALTLLASLCFAATLSTAAHAGSSFSYNSKIGVQASHTRSVYAQDMGKFTWINESASVNRIVVSLADQSLCAYDGTQLVAYSNISSGKPGHETPTGSFIISEKDSDHHSNLYNNASMPFYMRLTDDGVGLHAGFIPGYPASHGCVRLPLGMAHELYEHTESGTQVEITSNPMSAMNVSPLASSAVHLAQN